MNETSWQQEREMSKARHSDFWMSLYREAEMMSDEDNLEEYSLSIDPDIVRLADQCGELRAQLAAMTERKDGWRRVALKIRRQRNDTFEMEYGMGDGEYCKRAARLSSVGRREARNGHTD